ncbi:MAG: prolyl oligopeptidase family serine peptidase [Rhizobiaceae bacterium]
MIDAKSGSTRTLHTPPDQMGVPRGAPDGKHIAVIRAFCSDRGLVTGELTLLDLRTGNVSPIPTDEIDITSIEWRSATRLHLAGLRGHETVVVDYDLTTNELTEIWSSEKFTCGEWVPVAFPLADTGSLIVAESYARAPFIGKACAGELHEIASLAAPNCPHAMTGRGVMEPVSWTASDGWEIQGWLLRPEDADGATPLLVDVHGGPVSAHRNRWMARTRAAPLLVSNGWSVLFPNPRGSTGRGDAFARAVKGDMGGADVDDILSGIDMLVEKGWVDTSRVAVTGTSYGGFMSAWLPTRTDRFAAAIHTRGRLVQSGIIT